MVLQLFSWPSRYMMVKFHFIVSLLKTVSPLSSGTEQGRDGGLSEMEPDTDRDWPPAPEGELSDVASSSFDNLVPATSATAGQQPARRKQHSLSPLSPLMTATHISFAAVSALALCTEAFRRLPANAPKPRILSVSSALFLVVEVLHSVLCLEGVIRDQNISIFRRERVVMGRCVCAAACRGQAPACWLAHRAITHVVGSFLLCWTASSLPG